MTAIVAKICLLAAIMGSTALGMAAGLPAEDGLRAERSFTISVNAPPEKAFPLFGPARESEWSPDWKPNFIFPASGDTPVAGAVFSSKPKDGRPVSTWVMTVYDRRDGRIEYVEFTPEHSVTEIKVRVHKAAHHHSTATITYRRTALSPEAQPFIRRFADRFLQERVNWENAVNHYLATGQPLTIK